MEILAHNQIFPAHACKICGARDSDPDLLAAHELRHKMISETLTAMRRPGFMNGTGREMTSYGKCVDCDYVGKRVKGKCQKCYQRDRARIKRYLRGVA